MTGEPQPSPRASAAAPRDVAGAAPNEAFACLRGARRVWALAAVRADAARLAAAHRELAERLLPGDRMVYLGNLIGYGADTIATIDEAVAFRRDFLCLPGAEPDDIVYLRGAQEEMWRKLLQIQFATGPASVFDWMMHHGLRPTLAAYGVDPDRAPGILREGAVAISRWTNALRAAIRQHPGHDEFFASLKRAAYTAGEELLFVHAGLDPALTLPAQADHLWWGSPSFRAMAAPYFNFRRVIAGASPHGEGPHLGSYTICLDGGAGLGGTLNVACFDLGGTVTDSFAV